MGRRASSKPRWRRAIRRAGSRRSPCATARCSRRNSPRRGCGGFHSRAARRACLSSSRGFHRGESPLTRRGRCWWSGSGGIASFDGKTNAVVVPASEVTTPVALAMSPDGLLVCSSLGKQSVTLWDVAGDKPRLVRTISGLEVRDPLGVAFTTHPFEPPAQFGNFVPQPSNTGRDWTPNGTAIYNLRADATVAAVSELRTRHRGRRPRQDATLAGADAAGVHAVRRHAGRFVGLSRPSGNSPRAESSIHSVRSQA